jgi:MFS family permease
MLIATMLNSLNRRFNMSNNYKFYIWNGILFTLMTSLSKTYAVKFLYRLGGNEFHVSLFNALPGFVAVFAIIPGIILINNTNNRKLVMGRFFLASRIFTLCFAFVPFLPLSYQPIAFVLLTAFMNFPESMSATALQSFSGDIFKPEERATAISQRNKFSTLAQVLSFIVIGKVLSNVSNVSNIIDPEILIIRKYQIFFIIAFILGLFEIKTFYKLKEIKQLTTNKKLSILNTLADMKKNKKFISFMICSLLFHFGWQMGWPLFSIYQIDYHGADEWWLTILNITQNTVMFFSYNYWSKMIRTKGNSFVITAATVGMAITPVLYALSSNLYLLLISGLIMGFFTSGTTTVILSSLLEVIPENERMIYVGVHATLTSITLAVAPLAGNLVLGSYSIHAALIVTSLFRFIGSFAFFARNKKISVPDKLLSFKD